MTDPDGQGRDAGERRATITTTHDSDVTAEQVAASVRPDNTDAMATRTSGDRIVTTISRPTTGGLQATVDDYVVNLTLAAQCTTADQPRHDTPDTTHE